MAHIMMPETWRVKMRRRGQNADRAGRSPAAARRRPRRSLSRARLPGGSSPQKLVAGLDPGSRGDRYQVVVHVDAEVLRADGEGGSSWLADGCHVSAETSQRLACDSALVVMRHAADGRVLDDPPGVPAVGYIPSCLDTPPGCGDAPAVGRRTRAISPGLRRALEHRDGGCRFPGCGRKLCDAHHVEPWADGGETSLANTLLLCRAHHRAVHEEGFSMELAPNGEARFYRPDGRLLPAAPALPAVAEEPVPGLISRLASHRVVVDARETLPAWWGGPVDYAWEIDWLRSRDRRYPASAAG